MHCELTWFFGIKIIRSGSGVIRCDICPTFPSQNLPCHYHKATGSHPETFWVWCALFWQLKMHFSSARLPVFSHFLYSLSLSFLSLEMFPSMFSLPHFGFMKPSLCVSLTPRPLFLSVAVLVTGNVEICLTDCPHVTGVHFFICAVTTCSTAY